MNRKKKITDKSVLNLWRELVLRQGNNRCEYPNCQINAHQLHPHHFYSRSYKSIRYDPMNGICLCARHHTLGNESAHLDPDFKDKLIVSGVRSTVWRETLMARRNQVVKFNDQFRLEWYNKLLTILELTKDE